MPILEGLDGVQKMSKSLNNYIGITEPPSEIFGKTMSVSDTLMIRYYELLTDLDINEIKKMHPMEAKKKLAKIIVARFYSEKEADKAEEGFNSVFSKKQLPSDMMVKKIKGDKIEIVTLVVEAGFAPSNSEAKRLIKQGGVKIDGSAVLNEKDIVDVSKEVVLQVGKRNFARIICE